MHWKKFATEYLAFSRRDRIAVITLIILILGVYFLPELVQVKTPRNAFRDTTAIQAISRLERKISEKSEEEEDFKHAAYPYDRRENWKRKEKVSLFYFDPNTISEHEWQKLGLRDKTIRTILNYRDKGGKFRRPEDLKKVYGLFEDEYERLEPYIKIGNGQLAIGNGQLAIGNGQLAIGKGQLAIGNGQLAIGNEQYAIESELNGFVEKKNNKSFKDLTVYDINSADTSALIALPGIGSKLAMRIFNFRDKLGGFYSIEQVRETFGLADSTFQKIKQYLNLGNAPIKRINLNRVTLDELKSHPYFRHAIAGPIIAYRNEHGPFKRIEDLKNVMAVGEPLYNKIEKYLFIE